MTTGRINQVATTPAARAAHAVSCEHGRKPSRTRTVRRRYRGGIRRGSAPHPFGGVPNPFPPIFWMRFFALVPPALAGRTGRARLVPAGGAQTIHAQASRPPQSASEPRRRASHLAVRGRDSQAAERAHLVIHAAVVASP